MSEQRKSIRINRCLTRYHNEKVKVLVVATRVEMDAKKREQIHIDLRMMFFILSWLALIFAYLL